MDIEDMEHEVWFYRTRKSERPYNQKFNLNYKWAKEIAYAETPVGGYSEILQTSYEDGSPIYLRGTVYPMVISAKPPKVMMVIEYANGQVRRLNKNGSVGKYVKKK